MVRNIDQLKESLENRVQQNKSIKTGINIMKKIFADFDSIADSIVYTLPEGKFHELVSRNSKHFENNIAVGLNERGLRLSYIKEIIKHNVLQEFKKRNIKKWNKIKKLGFVSMFVIAWGVAHRRKAIPVFLTEEELNKYGYDSGLEDSPADIKSVEEAKYYDEYIYPPPMPPYSDNRWKGVKLTRGMRNQLLYLVKKSFKKYLEEKQFHDNEFQDIAYGLYRNSKILQFIFESVRYIEKENNIKVHELERELLSIYESLSNEKKQEVLENIKKKKELKDVYKSIGYYSDIYMFANSHRREGLSLNKALGLAIQKFKDSNTHLQDLIIRNNNDLNEVILYLHNSYYKTKYKNFNDF